MIEIPKQQFVYLISMKDKKQRSVEGFIYIWRHVGFVVDRIESILKTC